MQYFPAPLKVEENRAVFHRLKSSYELRGYTYFAAVEKTSDLFIGFIGLLYQDYASPCTPAVDIGWRLLPEFWSKGYASEGARACLDYGLNSLGLERVVAVCPAINIPSQKVMQRIGMSYGGSFLHPKLSGYPELESCVWYETKVDSKSQ
jgi:RimJ/RimL family protein N-acetyltransferase